MKDIPILFSGPMVRALLEGKKTQTRRILRAVPPQPADNNVVHPNPKHDHAYIDAYCGGKRTELNPRGMTDRWCWWTRDDRAGQGCKVRFVPGDRLWVKETYAVASIFTDVVEVRYRASENRSHTEYVEQIPVGTAIGAKATWPTWRPSIFMHRWASRLTLTVTDVRVQRLQDCSEVDAIAEGVEQHQGCDGPLAEYEALWDAINGPGSWDENPWIVAVSFMVECRNIDRDPS